YTLAYSDNVNVGTATVTVTFIGNYTGTRTLHFNIVARTLGQNDIVISDISSDPYTYTGSAVTPKPTVSTSEGTRLYENTDYTLAY
ncbi:MAG: glycosyl hydrolase family 5, partial [Clostridia bacterium]|nr:glycosyl hydrolase family 5 [Clostridia bacterium]